ncbi:hypothetical protein DUNSADRAFT_15141 [Dunaliella salina]|uniref:Protein SCAI n=1 Tax=Dunaliella salina TaxID=3046 RepID=A0ABQ7H250_DUNSA|nr:hypothetical protein DUNSADRAFT_15141 [Dunaliella salina]|eukprot:KAF5840939.1 hypothetical protein DUNSADRAFT_15141 [Dunaliella salina]
MADHLAEFQRLQRKATSSFDTIRNLASNDERAFTDAFRSFQSLWIYQQEHRPALMQAGLKRAEIGEISSKIGQLNYTVYQRCADTRFLIEAYIFYEAIRLRQYFEDEPISSSAAVKRLRFNARFIVVCLLLNKKEEACSLMLEFQAHINLTPDAQPWQSLVDEVSQFLAADVGMPLPRSPGQEIPFKPNLRCCPNSPLQAAGPHTPRISHAIIASYMHAQVKIAELPIDMFRMMLSLEWSNPSLEQHERVEDGSPAEPLESLGTVSPTGIAAALATAAAAAPPYAPPPCANPRKTTLYCTTTPQLLSALHSHAATQGTQGDSVLLLVLGVGSLRSHVGAAPASELQHQLDKSSGGPRRDLGSGAPSVHGSSASLAALQHSQAAAATAAAAAAHLVAGPAPMDSRSSTVSSPQPPFGNGAQGKAVGSCLPAGQHGSCSCNSCGTPDIGNAFCLSPPPALPLMSASAASVQQQQEEVQAAQAASGVAAAPAISEQPVWDGARAAGSAKHSDPKGTAQELASNGAHHESEPRPGFNLAQGAACCMEHLLLPQDLLPLTRRRLMLVVDSNAAAEMASLQGKEHGYPVVALLSPSHRPSAFGDYTKTGSLFTMFLSAPVMAFCLSMGVKGPSTQQLKGLQDAVEGALHEVALALQQVLQSSGSNDSIDGYGAWDLPFQDLMLRNYMTRFVLARGVWAHHRASTGRPECQALCFPPLPPEVDPCSALCRSLVLRIARVLDRQALFSSAKVAAPVEGMAMGMAALRVAA